MEVEKITEIENIINSFKTHLTFSEPQPNN